MFGADKTAPRSLCKRNLYFIELPQSTASASHRPSMCLFACRFENHVRAFLGHCQTDQSTTCKPSPNLNRFLSARAGSYTQWFAQATALILFPILLRTIRTIPVKRDSRRLPMLQNSSMHSHPQVYVVLFYRERYEMLTLRCLSKTKL